MREGGAASSHGRFGDDTLRALQALAGKPLRTRLHTDPQGMCPLCVWTTPYEALCGKLFSVLQIARGTQWSTGAAQSEARHGNVTGFAGAIWAYSTCANRSMRTRWSRSRGARCIVEAVAMQGFQPVAGCAP